MFWQVYQTLVSRGYWEANKEDGGDLGGGADGGAEDDSEKGKPTPAEAKLLKEVMTRKARQKELEAELAGMADSLKRFEGIDPEQVAKLLKEREEAEKGKLEAKGEWEKLKERMASEHAKEAQALKDRIAELATQVDKSASVVNRLTVGQNFDTSAFIAKDTVLTARKARVIYGAHFDVDADGNVVGYDKPRGENGRGQLVDAQGKPLPFEDAIKLLVDEDPDRDEILRSKRKSGSGSGSDGGKPADQGRKLSSAEKIARGLAERSK